jgi:glucosylceramidase
MALDETGKPNIGPYKCAGLVTINSQTKEVTRSGQFWAFAHYARSMQRDAVIIASEGDLTNVQHVAVMNPDGQFAAVLTNNGKVPTTVQLRDGLSMVKVDLPADSVTTLTWK